MSARLKRADWSKVRKRVYTIIALTACQMFFDKAFANDGELRGIGKIRWTLVLSGNSLESEKSALQNLIQQKLKSADIPVDETATSQLVVKIDSGRKTHLVLSATESVPLPNNLSVKKDVEIWTGDFTCNEKSVADKLATALDAFAIQYLKDNRETAAAAPVKSYGRPETHVPAAASASNSSASDASASPSKSISKTGSSDSNIGSKITGELKGLQDALNRIYKGTENTTSKPSRILFTASQTSSEFKSIYNSCGENTIDEAVKQAVMKLDEGLAGNTTSFLLAVLPPQSKSIHIESVPKIDWAPYMKKLQTDIKHNWYPAKSSHTERATVFFEVHSDKKIKNLRFDNPTEDPPFDGAAMAAIYNTVVSDFPPQAPDFVNISFSFDYNVWKKNRNGGSQLVQESSSTGTHTPLSPLPKTPAALEKLDLPPSSKLHSGNIAVATRLNNEAIKALQKGDYETAVVKLQAAIKEDPGYSLARENLAISLNNFGLQRRAEFTTALRFFQWAAYLDPENLTTQKNVNGMIRAMGKSDKSFEVRKQLGEQSEGNNDPIGALVEFEAACALHDDAGLRSRIGDIYAKRSEWSNALHQYQLARELAPSAELDQKIEKIKKHTGDTSSHYQR